jgi:outer membrane receptor protein involved in Fe transport
MIRFTAGILGAQYQNFGEMRTLGVEFEIKADMFPFLYGYLNATYQDMRDTREYGDGSNIANPTKNMRIPNIPYLMANAGLEFHKENLFGGKGQNTRLFADLSFIDEYYYDFEVTENAKRRIPRSTTLDLGFEHSFMNQRLFISGKVKNITDAKVISEFNRPLPGRSFGMKIRYIFK